MAIKDITTGLQLLSILSTEVERMAERQAAGALTGGDHQSLERLVKTYHILKTEDREAQKAMGGLSEEDLSKLAGEELDGSTNTAD